MTRGPRRVTAALAACGAFAAAILVALVAAPYGLGLLYGCVPPRGSCGDLVGWAMIISSPISLPLIAIVAAILAAVAYRGVMHAGSAEGGTS